MEKNNETKPLEIQEGSKETLAGRALWDGYRHISQVSRLQPGARCLQKLEEMQGTRSSLSVPWWHSLGVKFLCSEAADSNAPGSQEDNRL